MELSRRNLFRFGAALATTALAGGAVPVPARPREVMLHGNFGFQPGDMVMITAPMAFRDGIYVVRGFSAGTTVLRAYQG